MHLFCNVRELPLSLEKSLSEAWVKFGLSVAPQLTTIVTLWDIVNFLPATQLYSTSCWLFWGVQSIVDLKHEAHACSSWGLFIKLSIRLSFPMLLWVLQNCLSMKKKMFHACPSLVSPDSTIQHPRFCLTIFWGIVQNQANLKRVIFSHVVNARVTSE